MKEKIGFWLLNPASKAESLLLSLFLLLLPTQFGKHFWPDFSIVSGIRIDYLSPIIYVTDVLLIVLFGVAFIRWIREFKMSKLKIQKSFFILGFILLFFTINITFSDRPLLSFYGFAKLTEFAFLAIYLARTIRYRFQLQWIALLFAISASFESLLAIFQYLNQGSLNGIFYFFGERMFTGGTPGIANASIGGTLVLRPYATFPHPNVLAGYLLIAIVLIWNFVLKNPKRWIQIIAVLSLLINSIALLLTFGRVAILLWTLLLLLVFWRMITRKLKTFRAKIVTFVIVVIGLAIVGTFPLTHEVILRFAQTSLSDESVTERTALLSASLKMIQQNLLTGVGLDNFIPALAPLQKPMPLGLYLQPVHNIFVLVFAETGIIGFGLLVWLLVATVLEIKNQESRIKGTCLVLLVIIAVAGSFDHYWLTLQQGQLLFATAIGISWAKLQKSSQ